MLSMYVGGGAMFHGGGRRELGSHVRRWFTKCVVRGDATAPETFGVLTDKYVQQLHQSQPPPQQQPYNLSASGQTQLVDVICTDPPYCLLERRRKGGDLRDPKAHSRSKTENDDAVPRFANIRDYTQFTQNWLANALSITKPSAMVIIWTNALGRQPIVKVATQDLRCALIGEYVWAKRSSTSPLTDNSTKNEILLRVYESALVFRRISPVSTNNDSTVDTTEAVAPNLIDFGIKSKGDLRKLPWSCITGYHDDIPSVGSDGRAAAEAGKDLHPCKKPLAALEPLMRTWVRPGDVLLDCFSGSGAILNAASVVGAGAALGMEVSSHWAKVAES
jgi:site-specific DNA-methyltransferase (adenine-specific)